MSKNDSKNIKQFLLLELKDYSRQLNPLMSKKKLKIFKYKIFYHLLKLNLPNK